MRAGRDDRSARFVCSIALASADGTIIGTTEGVCEGHLAQNPRGEGGFGYDPIFVPEEYDVDVRRAAERHKGAN